MKLSINNCVPIDSPAPPRAPPTMPPTTAPGALAMAPPNAAPPHAPNAPPARPDAVTVRFAIICSGDILPLKRSTISGIVKITSKTTCK